MALLYEYAVTPDIFDASYYPHEEVSTARFEQLKSTFLEESLVRNLRNGQWQDVFQNRERQWHLRGRELLRKLVNQNRLRRAQAAGPNPPNTDVEWCIEAMASHGNDPLTGIISTSRIARELGDHPILGRIERLSSSACWNSRSVSTRLTRCLPDYENHLRLIMQSANSIMLIDPHLDPTRTQYYDVLPLLLLAQGRTPVPRIEIHRVIRVGSGPTRETISPEEWESRFRSSWDHVLSAVGLRAEVFIWDDFHDRFLITDLIGILISNGFDISNNPNDVTTWSRLGRSERDDIQREFDPACDRHVLQHRFVVA